MSDHASMFCSVSRTVTGSRDVLRDGVIVRPSLPHRGLGCAPLCAPLAETFGVDVVPKWCMIAHYAPPRKIFGHLWPWWWEIGACRRREGQPAFTAPRTTSSGGGLHSWRQCVIYQSNSSLYRHSVA